MRVGIDLTACWRPRAGMQTLAINIAERMIALGGDRAFTLFYSRERPSGVNGSTTAVLSPYRHEVLNKLRWLPAVEGEAGLDVMFYPYWPSPPRRRAGSPPAVMVVHDLAFRIRPREVPWQQRVYLGSIMSASLRRSAAVLTPSESTRKDLIENYPIKGLAERVRVVPEGWSLGEVKAGPLPHGVQPGFLLAVGTIEPRKNYRRLLAAYRLLKGRTTAPPLVVAGQVGWAYGSALDELRAEAGVHLLGHVSDSTLRALYKAASVLVFPSLYEGFGLPLLEAMAEGLPALVGNQGALPELAGDAALLVDPTDVEAIADGVENLLIDDGFRARLADAGRSRAAGFSWDGAAASALQVLDAATIK